MNPKIVHLVLALSLLATGFGALRAQPCAMGEPIKPVNLRFLSLEGVATLVGFDEFINPSVPPRKFLRRQTTGSISIIDYPYSSSCESSPSEARLVWEGSIYDSPHMRATGSLIVVSQTETTVTYVARDLEVVNLDTGQSGFVGARLTTNYGWLINGWQFTVPAGSQIEVGLQVYYLFMTTVANGFITAGQPPGLYDEWLLFETVSPATGALTLVNGSTRRIGEGGTVAPIPCDTPGQCYGWGVAQSTLAIQRTSNGVGCTGGRKFAGSVLETLSEQDTDEAAEKRAEVTRGTSNIAYRLRRVGFSFPFCTVKYWATFNITCPGDYVVTVHYTIKPHESTAEGEPRSTIVRQRFDIGQHTIAGEVDPQRRHYDYTITGVDARAAPGCEGNVPGTGSFAIGSVKVWLGMGNDVAGLTSGGLSIDESAVSPRLYSPLSLVAAVPDGPGIETIRDGGYMLRQVRTPQALADIVVLNPACYEVRFYLPAQTTGQDPLTSVYTVSGAPFVVYRFENPDEAQSTRLRITETRGGAARTVEYGYDAVSSTWSIKRADDVIESEVLSLGRGEKVKTTYVRDRAGNLVSATARTYRDFAWGEEMIREVADPSGAALTTNYEYYDAVPMTDGNYKRLRQRTDASGGWERFEYDGLGRVVKTTRPFLNAAPETTDDSVCRTTEVQFDDLPDADGDGKPEELVTTIERLAGQESARRFRIDWSKRVQLGGVLCRRRSDVVSVAARAAWDAPENLVTDTLMIAEGKFAGRARRILKSDGTVVLTSYALADDGVLTTTVRSGQPSAARDDVIDGRRAVTVANAVGHTTSEQVFDIATGLSLSLWVATQFDEFGRPTRVDFDDGTYSTRQYACCGLASERDRTGFVTRYTYDAAGRQETVMRGAITTKNVYDASGRVVAIVRIGSDGSELTQETSVYDLAGRLIETRDALNRRTVYAETYDDATGLTTRTTTNPDGGNSIEVSARDGSRTSVGGTAAAPRTFEHGVDPSGVFTKEIRVGVDANNEPAATEWVKTYVDFAGRQSRTVFADGSEAQLSYNRAGQLARQTDPDGVTVLMSYNARGERSITALDLNRNGAIDLAGPDRVVRTSSSIARKVDDGATYTVLRTTTEQWEVDNQDAAAVVAVNEQTADGMRTWQIVRGLTTKSITTLDGMGGRSITTISPDGVRAIQTFLGERPISSKTTTATGTQLIAISYTYDAHGRVQSVTDARNGTTQFTYYADDQVRTVTTPDPDATRSGAGYDPQVTTYAYETAGRVQRVTLPDGGVVNTSYWPTGAVKRTWGARTVPAEYAYDPQGRVKSLTTWQDFAADAGKAVTKWDYDAKRGWLERKRHADDTGPTYAYYPSGRLRTRTWARLPQLTMTYAYTTAGELSATDYSDNTADANLAYDRAGRLISITDGSGSRSFGYHLSGQLAVETYTAGPLNGFRLERSFDSLQRLAAVAIASGQATVLQRTGYTYDAAGRLDAVATGANSIAYRYAANSVLVEGNTFSSAAAPRLAVARAYDGLDRLVSVDSRVDASTGLVRSYVYDGANQRTRVTQTDNAYWSYGYDTLGQVTAGKKFLADGAAALGGDHAWTFDSIGNRRTAMKNGTVAIYAANALNQYAERTVPGVLDVTGAAGALAKVTIAVNNGPPVAATRQGEQFYHRVVVNNTNAAQTVQLTITGVKNDAGPNGEDAVTTITQPVLLPKAIESFQYDADGNLTDDARWHYAWDAENRLVSMETSVSAADAGTARRRLEFVYDAASRRIAKKVFTWSDATWVLDSHTLYVYDGWNMVAELNALAGLAPIRTYAWGLDVSGTLAGAGGVGGLVAINDAATGATHFPAYDGTGNVIGLVNAADGTITARYDYNPFGEPAVTEGTYAAPNPFRFSTKYHDTETGQVYFGYRYYAADTGRWLSRDPIHESGGTNLFGFLDNSPVNFVDPHGLVLFAVGGTNSVTDNVTINFRTNVYRFWNDWRGPGRAGYSDGPGSGAFGGYNPGNIGGHGSSGVAEAGYEFICTELKKHTGTTEPWREDPVFLVGHSRGGMIVMNVAKMLKNGCPCDRAGSAIVGPIPVRFMGLYDAVSMTPNSRAEPVADNVEVVVHGLRDLGLGSRSSWGNTGASGGKKYIGKTFWANHSAMGGDPAEGDVLDVVPISRNVKGSIEVDEFIRSAARRNGATLGGR